MHRTGSRVVSAPVTSPAEPASGDDTEHSPGRHRTHRTWPERLTIATTFLAAALCLVVAAALVGGYLIARQRNVVDLEDPSQRAVAQVAGGAAPIVVLAGGEDTATGPTNAAEVTITAGVATATTTPGNDPGTATAGTVTAAGASAASAPAIATGGSLPAATAAAVTDAAPAPTATFPPVDP